MRGKSKICTRRARKDLVGIRGRREGKKKKKGVGESSILSFQRRKRSPCGTAFNNSWASSFSDLSFFSSSPSPFALSPS